MRRSPALALGLLLPALACGKRGDPRPPLGRTPPPLAQFRVAQRGARLVVSGTAPRASSEGAPLRVLRIELLTALGEGDFLKLAKKRTFSVQAGETFAEPDTLPPAGTLVRVAARAVAGRRPSALTGLVSLSVQAPPPVPQNLTASREEGGIALAWTGRRPAPLPAPATPPPSTPPGAPPAPAEAAPASGATAPASRAGFWVYRRAPAGAYDRPLFPEPTTQKGHLDAEAGASEEWCYVVRAVVQPDPTIESDSSNEVCLSGATP